MKRFLLAVCLFIFPVLSHAQAWSGIINATRATDWSLNGIPPVPARTTQCGSTIAAYTGSAATINTAIAACPSGQFVHLGTGTFNLSTGINYGATNNVTVRGDGPTNTIVKFTAGDACGGQTGDVCMKNSSGLFEGSAATQPGGANAADWSSTYTQGTTSIAASNVGSSGIINGQVIILDQADDASDTSSTYSCSVVSATCSQQGYTGAPCRVISAVHYCQQQFVTVTAGCASACTGAGPFTLTIAPPIYMNNWRSGQTPKIWWTGAQLIGAGLENLTFDHNGSGTSVKAGISMFNCYQCYAKNVRDLNSNRNHVWMYLSSQNTVRDNYFYGTQGGASQSYGVEMFGADNNLIENNICDTIVTCIMPGVAMGNIVAYNYDTNDSYNVPTDWLETTYSSHDGGTGMNLFEGNQTQGFTCDDLHGSSNTQTLFRNRLTGWQTGKDKQTNPILFYSFCRSYNVIGNVLGTSTYHNKYESSPVAGNLSSCDLAIYHLGRGLTDATCSGAAGSVNDDNLTETTLYRWGNYDTVNGSVQWNSSEVPTSGTTYVSGQSVPGSHTLPASFYLSSRPAFFPTPWGTPPWPPNGPDRTSGNIPNVGGFANNISAELCYANTAQDSVGYPSTTIILFDAGACYGVSANSIYRRR